MANTFCCTTIFCDDVRHELNGKVSLMGVYGGDMYVTDFPVTLPKICSFFELHIPPTLENNSADAVISVMKGAEKVGAVTLNIPPVSTEEPRHGKPYAFKRALGIMEFPSITFSEPTLMEVVAQVDGQSVVAGRLWVTTFPQAEEVLTAG